MSPNFQSPKKQWLICNIIELYSVRMDYDQCVYALMSGLGQILAEYTNFHFGQQNILRAQELNYG